MRVTAVSPHLDDAAFSVGGTLAALADAGHDVTVVTCFTRSVADPQGFALACQLDKGLGPEVDYMALRRDEDARAAAVLGVEPVWLPLAEAPHRGYGSPAALFGALLPQDDVGPEVKAAIAGLVAAHRPDLVLAPQAVGGHVDHVVVVEALRRLALDRPVLWWRDFPYTIRPGTPPEPFASVFTSLPSIAPALPEAALASRCTAALAYGSQLGFQFGGPDHVADAMRRAGAAESFRAQGAALERLPWAAAA